MFVAGFTDQLLARQNPASSRPDPFAVAPFDRPEDTRPGVRVRLHACPGPVAGKRELEDPDVPGNRPLPVDVGDGRAALAVVARSFHERLFVKGRV